MVKKKVKEVLVPVHLSIDGNGYVFQAHQLHLAFSQGLVETVVFATQQFS